MYDSHKNRMTIDSWSCIFQFESNRKLANPHFVPWNCIHSWYLRNHLTHWIFTCHNNEYSCITSIKERDRFAIDGLLSRRDIRFHNLFLFIWWRLSEESFPLLFRHRPSFTVRVYHLMQSLLFWWDNIHAIHLFRIFFTQKQQFENEVTNVRVMVGWWPAHI